MDAVGIPDIEKVRNGQYTKERDAKPKEKTVWNIETRVSDVIEDLNDSIKNGDHEYPMTATELGEHEYDVFRHPRFQQYVEKLVQAGYLVRISRPPTTLIEIHWGLDCQAELVWYDYEKEMKEHREILQKQQHNNMIANIKLYSLWAVFIAVPVFSYLVLK